MMNNEESNKGKNNKDEALEKTQEHFEKLADYYRDRLPKHQRSWGFISALAGISRNAVYDIKDPLGSTKIETIARFCMALKTTADDFEDFLAYKGYALKMYDRYDYRMYLSFANNDYDIDKLFAELKKIKKEREKQKKKENDSNTANAT